MQTQKEKKHKGIYCTTPFWISKFHSTLNWIFITTVTKYRERFTVKDVWIDIQHDSFYDFILIQCNLHDQIGNLLAKVTLLHILNSLLTSAWLCIFAKAILLHTQFLLKEDESTHCRRFPGQLFKESSAIQRNLKFFISSTVDEIAESSNCQKKQSNTITFDVFFGWDFK